MKFSVHTGPAILPVRFGSESNMDTSLRDVALPPKADIRRCQWHVRAYQLTAEMIFQSGADDLLAVEQILRPDESHHRIDQHR